MRKSTIIGQASGHTRAKQRHWLDLFRGKQSRCYSDTTLYLPLDVLVAATTPTDLWRARVPVEPLLRHASPKCISLSLSIFSRFVLLGSGSRVPKHMQRGVYVEKKSVAIWLSVLSRETLSILTCQPLLVNYGPRWNARLSISIYSVFSGAVQS